MILNLLKNNIILLKDFIGKKEKVFDNKKHILSGSDWLLKSQKVNGDGGYSVKFSLVRNWDVSYPETTGYIIETLFDVYNYYGDKKYYNSIIKAGDWLLKIQMKDGSWGDSVKNIPAIFDIGQIIFGLIKLYKITKDEKYLNSAILGADFILENQEKNGSFIKCAFNNQSHTYYSRVSWALLELWKITKIDKYKKSAINQLNWTLTKQKENGFFEKSSFFNDGNPVLHTIIYTIRGLYESGKILGEEKYIVSGKKTADTLLNKYKLGEKLYAHFDNNWNTTCNFYCLTGLAQLSILWQKLYIENKEKDYLFYSMKLNNFLKKTQDIQTLNKNIKGAIKGSYPIWGKYMIGAYPNWATKFFIDALLLEEKINNKEKINNEDFFVKKNNFFNSEEFVKFLYSSFGIIFDYHFFRRFYLHFKIGKLGKISPIKNILFNDRLIITDFNEILRVLFFLENKNKDISLYIPLNYIDFIISKFDFVKKWGTFILDLRTFKFKIKIQNKINELLFNNNYSIKIYDLNNNKNDYNIGLLDYNFIIKNSGKKTFGNYLPSLELYENNVKHFFIIFFNKEKPIGSMFFFFDDDFLYEIDISICYNFTNEKYIGDLFKFKGIEYAKKLGIKYYDLMGFNPNNNISKKEENIRRYKKKYGGDIYYYLKLN